VIFLFTIVRQTNKNDRVKYNNNNIIIRVPRNTLQRCYSDSSGAFERFGSPRRLAAEHSGFELSTCTYVRTDPFQTNTAETRYCSVTTAVIKKKKKWVTGARVVRTDDVQVNTSSSETVLSAFDKYIGNGIRARTRRENGTKHFFFFLFYTKILWISILDELNT
jgi:hypothetical protein